MKFRVHIHVCCHTCTTKPQHNLFTAILWKKKFQCDKLNAFWLKSKPGRMVWKRDKEREAHIDVVGFWLSSDRQKTTCTHKHKSHSCLLPFLLAYLIDCFLIDLDLLFAIQYRYRTIKLYHTMLHVQYMHVRWISCFSMQSIALHTSALQMYYDYTTGTVFKNLLDQDMILSYLRVEMC